MAARHFPCLNMCWLGLKQTPERVLLLSCKGNDRGEDKTLKCEASQCAVLNRDSVNCATVAESRNKRKQAGCP